MSLRSLIAAALLGLAALPASAANDGFKVVTTFTVIADIAQNVAGDAAIVESITRPDAEIHNYQPTPGDILKAQDADLILWNGLNLEQWFERFFRNLKNVPSAVVSEASSRWASVKGRIAASPTRMRGCRRRTCSSMSRTSVPPLPNTIPTMPGPTRRTRRPMPRK